MAKIVCVLYEDPVDGYPTTYARDGLPDLERYPDGQTLPTPSADRLHAGPAARAASPASWGCGRSSKPPATPWSSPRTRTAPTPSSTGSLPTPRW